MLLLLGDQLIRDAGIAVFELVKNAYDADASSVDIEMLNADDPKKGQIIVSDNGIGMGWNVVTQVWLEPGTDYRESQKKKGIRTAIHNRTPLGEKGIGRFAAHKLGRFIKLVTREVDAPEVVVQINWDDFLGDQYLSDTTVSVIEQAPMTFSARARAPDRDFSPKPKLDTRPYSRVVSIGDVHIVTVSATYRFHCQTEALAARRLAERAARSAASAEDGAIPGRVPDR